MNPEHYDKQAPHVISLDMIRNINALNDYYAKKINALRREYKSLPYLSRKVVREHITAEFAKLGEAGYIGYVKDIPSIYEKWEYELNQAMSH